MDEPCSCKDEHKGDHPMCPRCGTEETRRTRNFGKPVGNEWWCLKCHHRWPHFAVKFIDFDAVTRKVPLGVDSCVMCQRAFRPNQRHRRVQLPGSEPFAIHPADAHLIPEGLETTFHNIGIDCARKLGLEWTHPPIRKGQ